MIHPTIETLRRLRLTGMAKALEEQQGLPDCDRLSFDERLAMLVDREAVERGNAALAQRLRLAKLRDLRSQDRGGTLATRSAIRPPLSRGQALCRCHPHRLEAAMDRIWLLAMAFFGFVTVAVAAEEERAKQPSAPAVPPASGSSSSELSRSGGVITPPIGVDPQMKQTPPPSGDSMPVVPPPGTPGGNPAIKPK